MPEECWGCGTAYATLPSDLCVSCGAAMESMTPISGRPVLNHVVAETTVTADDERDRCWRCDVRRSALALGLCERCHGDLIGRATTA